MTRTLGGRTAAYELLQLSLWVLCLGYVLVLGIRSFFLPAAMLLTVSLFAFLGFGWLLLVWRGGARLLASPLDAGLAFFLIALILSTLFSMDLSRSVRLLWPWAACLVVFYMALTAFRSGWSIEPFLKALLTVTALLVAASYFQLYLWLRGWFDTFAGTGLWPQSLLRAWGVTTSPNTFAVLLNMALMLALAARRQCWRSPLLLLWLVAAVPMLFIPGSRSGWLGAAAGVAVLMAGGKRLRSATFLQKRADWLRATGFALLAGLALLALMFVRRPETLTTLAEVNERNRLLFWQIAFESWQRAPWFGTGLNTFVSSYAPAVHVPPGVPFTTAHNIFFNTLAEMGLIGLLALLAILVQLARFIWQAERQKRLDGRSYGLLAALGAFFVHTLFDVPEPSVLFLAALLLAAFVARAMPEPAAVRRPPLRLAWIAAWLLLVAGGFLGWQATSAYAAGVAAVERGDWSEANGHFARVGAILPYDESSSMMLQGLAEGVLALEDSRHLARAVELHERLIAADPGWSVHYANLAALYWQQGRTTQAIRTMEQAIELSPDVPPFFLNLALWHEALGHSETASALYQRLYRMEGVWREAPFWGTTPVRQIAARPNAATILPLSAPVAIEQPLAGLNEAQSAIEPLEALVAANPYDAQAILALGIAQLENGAAASAALTLRRAAALAGNTAPATLVNLWRQVAADDAAAFYNALDAASRQSAHGFGFSGEAYLRMAHQRPAPSFDLLPQLKCLSVSSGLAAHLWRLRDWYAQQNETEPVATIDATLAGSGEGLAPCMRLPEK